MTMWCPIIHSCRRMCMRTMPQIELSTKSPWPQSKCSRSLFRSDWLRDSNWLYSRIHSSHLQHRAVVVYKCQSILSWGHLRKRPQRNIFCLLAGCFTGSLSPVLWLLLRDIDQGNVQFLFKKFILYFNI